MPPTTAELIRDQGLGELVDHDDIDLSGIAAPQSVARRKVRAALSCRASTEQIDDAVLVTDELVGNAVEHGNGVVSIILDIYEKGAAVSVLDRGTDAGAILTPPTADKVGDARSEGGRGLFLVEQFATAWTVVPGQDGIVVMAVFALTGGDL